MQTAVQVTPGVDGVRTTPFEALTCAAFWLFRERQIDVAVLECGMGGRLDAVNTADPVVSVVTQIAHDHTKTLGNTLAAIAGEKVHIARSGRPLVLAQPAIVVAAARRAGIAAECRKLGSHVRVSEVVERGLQETTCAILEGELLDEALHIEVNLAGRHQVDNAALAVMAYIEYSRHLSTGTGSSLPGLIEVVPALSKVPWPVRGEWISRSPAVVLDAAHNEAGLRSLVEMLASSSRRWQVIVSVSHPRDPGEMLRSLAPIAECIWIPRMEAGRLLPASEVARAAQVAAPQVNIAVGSKSRCLYGALAEVVSGGGVAVTGSIYAMGEWLQSGLLESDRLDRWLNGNP